MVNRSALLLPKVDEIAPPLPHRTTGGVVDRKTNLERHLEPRNNHVSCDSRKCERQTQRINTVPPRKIMAPSTTIIQQPVSPQHETAASSWCTLRPEKTQLARWEKKHQRPELEERSTPAENNTMASQLTHSTRCLGGIKKYVKTCTNGQKRHPVVTTPFSLPLTVSWVASHESPRSKLT